MTLVVCDIADQPHEQTPVCIHPYNALTNKPVPEMLARNPLDRYAEVNQLKEQSP